MKTDVHNGFIHFEEELCDGYILERYLQISNIKSISQLRPINGIQQPTEITFLDDSKVVISENDASDLIGKITTFNHE